MSNETCGAQVVPSGGKVGVLVFVPAYTHLVLRQEVLAFLQLLSVIREFFLVSFHRSTSPRSHVSYTLVSYAAPTFGGWRVLARFYF